MSPRVAMTPQQKPELPNPAANQAPSFATTQPAPHFAAAPRDFHAAEPVAPPLPAAAPSSPPPPLAISEILLPSSSPRPALAPDLPPDHPLEPGTRPSSRAASPSERIAASENAISEIPAAPKEPVSSSSFIAAARRAAQAAAAHSPPDKGRAAKADKVKAREAVKSGKDGAKEPSTVTSKIRSLLVGASVVVIVLGTFKMAMNLLDGGVPSLPPMEKSAEPSTLTPSDSNAKAPAQQQSAPAPSMTSPTPI